MSEQQAVHRRVVVDRHEHERRIEAHRAERAHRHPVIASLVVACRDDGDAGGESAKHTAKGVRVDHADGARETVSRRETPNTFQRYPSRITSRAGTKSPVTPMRRSA